MPSACGLPLPCTLSNVHAAHSTRFLLPYGQAMQQASELPGCSIKRLEIMMKLLYVQVEPHQWHQLHSQDICPSAVGKSTKSDSLYFPYCYPSCSCSLPQVVGCLVVHVGGNIVDLILAQAAGPCGHGILAIGHLHHEPSSSTTQ